jgi:hypothetical protein
LIFPTYQQECTICNHALLRYDGHTYPTIKVEEEKEIVLRRLNEPEDPYEIIMDKIKKAKDLREKRYMEPEPGPKPAKPATPRPNHKAKK